jgi:hypothetical protein
MNRKPRRITDIADVVLSTRQIERTTQKSGEWWAQSLPEDLKGLASGIEALLLSNFDGFWKFGW